MTSPPTARIWHRLDARDRALYVRWTYGPEPTLIRRRAWTAITHAGGATATILTCVIPLLLFEAAIADAARVSLTTLVASHLIVQLIKRSVARERPTSTTAGTTLIAAPDRFSFPSGHAAAAMSAAFGYAATFPTAALPLVLFAIVIGVSRVRLGVHYLGDVLAGQTIAVVTGVFIVLTG